MNKTIIRFRFRQLWKIIREIPLVYLLLLIIFTGVSAIIIYRLAGTPAGAIGISLFLLLGLYALQKGRRDFHFISLIEEKPWRVFSIEYLLFSFPFMVILAWQGFYWMCLAIIAGCLSISFMPQKVHRIRSGITPPSFITYDAFELRGGIRQYGGFLLILYVGCWCGLFYPFVSFAFLWLFTLSWVESFRISESLQILCAKEYTSRRFIHWKIILYIRLYVIAALPVCVVYAFLYPDSSWFALLFFVYALLNIALLVVTKYAYYTPQTKIVAGQIAITLSLMGMLLPLLLPLTLFYLIKNYLAARQNLKPYLDAYDTESTCSIQ